METHPSEFDQILEDHHKQPIQRFSKRPQKHFVKQLTLLLVVSRLQLSVLRYRLVDTLVRLISGHCGSWV